jgi:plastocyanin
MSQESVAIPERQEEDTTSVQESPIPPGAVFEDGTIDEPVGEGQYDALIAYTDAGYAPTTITIKKGDTVRFINNSHTADSWPASAVHPTHGIYPQKSATDCLGSSFDACRGLKPGESWDFTFNDVGTWRFHDHIHPSKTGSVIVE